MKLSNGMTVLQIPPLGETSEQKENIQAWISLLVSGKFTQGVGCYHDSKGALCILGTACETYRLRTGNGEWRKNRFGNFNFHGVPENDPNMGMPPEVSDYFGLYPKDFRIKVVYSETDPSDFEWLKLSRLNDYYSVTFEEFVKILLAAVAGGIVDETE